MELIDNKLGGIRKKVSKDRIKYCRFGETLVATVSLCFRKQKRKYQQSFRGRPFSLLTT